MQREAILAALQALSPEELRAHGMLHPAPSIDAQDTVPHPTLPPAAQGLLPALLPVAWQINSSQNAEDCEEGVWCGLPLLDASAYDTNEEFVEKSRKCILKAVFEHQVGIFEFIVRSAGDMARDVVFQSAILDEDALKLECFWRRQSKSVNAITFFRECLRCDDEIMREIEEEEEDDDDDPLGFLGFGKEENNVPTKEERQLAYLQFLPRMLEVLRRNELVHHLREILSTRGLWWTGARDQLLWQNDGCREQLITVIGFLIDNKTYFRDSIRYWLAKEKEEERTCALMASYASETFFDFLDSMLDKDIMEKMLFPARESTRFLSLHAAWNRVITIMELHQVERMWGYLEGKLMTRDRAGEFLLRKNPDGEDAMFAACCSCHPPVLFFVWELFGRFFDHSERNKILQDSIASVKSSFRVWGPSFFSFLFSLLESGELDGQDVSRILLRMDGRTYHFLQFSTYGMRSPSVLYQLQTILLTGKVDSDSVLGNMRGHYECLIDVSLDEREWSDLNASGLSTVICKEFDALRQTKAHLNRRWMDPSLLEEREMLSYGRSALEEKAIAIGLKALYVLMDRQLRCEKARFSEEEIIERLAKECLGIYYHVPRPVKADDSKKTHAYFIPHLFNSLSILLSRKKLKGLLFHDDADLGTAFDITLEKRDTLAFQALYDVSRWMLGKDALSIFSLPGPRLNTVSVLESVLWLQMQGHFNLPK